MMRWMYRSSLIFSILALISAASVMVFEYDLNRGAALYQKGEYREAAEFFSKVAASEDPHLRQSAYYNGGNCWYRLGQKAEDGNAAVRLYRASLDQYDKALGFNANDEDAQFNKKLAKKRLEEAVSRGSAADRQKRETGDPLGRENKDPQNIQGKNEAPSHRDMGRQGTENTERGDDLKEKSAGKGKGRGPISFKKGEMSRDDAEMLLEEFRKREPSGSTRVDRAKRGYDQEVEKNW